jgi:hypothetical protein
MRRHAGSVLLHVRGRDVEETETSLQFNKAICRWTILGADAAEAAISDERKQIIDAMSAFHPAHEKDGMSVSEIMAATERTDRNAVDQLLFKMVRDGEIRRLKRGVYGKIDKKERKETQTSDAQSETRDLTDLIDRTGHLEKHDDGLDIPKFLRRVG